MTPMGTDLLIANQPAPPPPPPPPPNPPHEPGEPYTA